MATIDITSCAEIVTAKTDPTKLETKIWKARKVLLWWAGRDMKERELDKLTLDILDLLTEREPQNCRSPHSIALELGAPEPVVRRIVDTLLTKGVDYIDARKAEGGE